MAARWEKSNRETETEYVNKKRNPYLMLFPKKERRGTKRGKKGDAEVTIGEPNTLVVYEEKETVGRSEKVTPS